MAKFLLNLLFASIFIVYCYANGNDYQWGALVAGDTLLAKEMVTKKGFFGTVTTHEYVYQQVGAATPKTINAIKIVDKKKFKGATAEVTNGGVGSTEVTIKFTSLRGSGIKSLVEIYGQSLGLKSPFIEFRNEFEVLANNSIALNITKDEQALMHQEGLRKLGAFIKPVDLRDSETGYVKANLTKKVATPMPQRTQNQRRLHPIQEEMDQKQIILLDEDTDENGLPASLTDEDRKFIKPMALKNSQPDPRLAQSMARSSMVAPPTPRTTTTTTTTKKPTTPATPEFASNIEDLKKHILFLQNLTKHDSNFQSKFVVFPSLQKDKASKPNQQMVTTTSTTVSPKVPLRPIYQYSAPVLPPTRKPTLNINSKIPQTPPFGGYYHNDDDESLSSFLQPVNAKDKIAIVPQVLLLNDQNKDRRVPPTTTTSTTTSTTTTTTSTTTTTTTRRPTKPTKLPPCVRNPDSPKCIRLRKREELQRQRDREQLLREQEKYWPRYEPYRQTINNTKRFAVSIEIPDSLKMALNESENKPQGGEENLQILSRFVRSTHKRRNIGAGLQGQSTSANDKFASKYGSSAFLERDSMISATGGRDYLITNPEQFGMMTANATVASPTVPAYSEPLDLNPDNCYLVDGMSYGQKKQCVLHTSVMPAISRGARATIQECQFQFKNRRWNCTTTEDNTVFGPMTGLGSPEMAFIHALAAAAVTSFIARACRDGQLASCGCSSGSRPKQLHDDWTWGGCGDNLEYAYKFATDFIDIREKETRRGTRGVGNPEKRGRGQRMHQRRLQQQQQQQQNRQHHQQMLADDASVSMTSSVNNETLATGRQQKKQQQQQQRAYLENNKATSTTNDGSNGTATPSLPSSQSSSSGSASGASFSSDLKSFENTNKTVNNSSIKADATTTHSNASNTVATLSNTPPLPTNISNMTLSMTSSSQQQQQKQKQLSNSPTDATSFSHTHSQRQQQQRQRSSSSPSSLAPPRQEESSYEEEDIGGGLRIKPEDLLELQERITKEILNSKLQEKEMLELQEKINREILNSKVFNMDSFTNGGSSGGGGGSSSSNIGGKRKKKRKNQRAVNGMLADVGDGGPYATNIGQQSTTSGGGSGGAGKWKNGISAKARSLMNLHNNEAGRRAVIKKTRITCKCHGVSGSCSLITCWQQLSSIREIGDYLREKYEESTEVKLNKRGRLQVKDPQFKVPTAHDLVYLDESPDWCRSNKQLQWPGTHGRVCNKTSNGLDGCGILCCGRGYNTKNIVVRERCNCKFHWCCQVKCDVCVKIIEEHTCK